MSWDKIAKRFSVPTDIGFYACVDRDGHWFDSSVLFSTAVHWCAMNYGYYNLSPEEEMDWMNKEGIELGVSIVHSSKLKALYEAGMLN